MEEGDAGTQKEPVSNTSGGESSKKQPDEATGEVSARASKPPEESGARFNRLKLFDKVMQKSLEKFIEHARYVNVTVNSLCVGLRDQIVSTG